MAKRSGLMKVKPFSKPAKGLVYIFRRSVMMSDWNLMADADSV